MSFNTMSVFENDLSIVISGEAGQGLNTIETLSMFMLRNNGYKAFVCKEFMSRVRGGNNTSEIRISSTQPHAYLDKIDILLVLAPDSISRLETRLSSKTIIIGESKNIPSRHESVVSKIIPLDIEGPLQNIGGTIYKNSFLLGLISKILSCKPEMTKELIKKQFLHKGDEITTNNIIAFERGELVGNDIPLKIKIDSDKTISSHLVLTGTEAISLGVIAGGCNFISSYPMSPSTGVLAYLAKKSEEAGIIVEQAEDEIAAINMMLGAWYAGARALVTTSGGGFDLMTEGLSLAGMVESPAVIHLAQRPGPATGLPTRTEQGDLNLALYGGHGEFPRVIYAPGNLTDAFQLSLQAFNIADQFQVPVFILSDQYLLDSIGIVEKFKIDEIPVRNNFIETSGDYQRYKITPSGISPRGIPGFGQGLVCADSDEHSEDGRITENFGIRTQMMDKRLRKLDHLIDIEPEIIGNPDYQILIIGWGSNDGCLREVYGSLNQQKIAIALFKQIFPLPKSTGKLLEKANLRIAIENNSTGQFSRLLESETLLRIQKKILKYNGLPFSVEELKEKINEVLP